MVATIASLDLGRFVVSDAGMPAMVTLTLPGNWQAVAPTAARFKALVFAFRKRYSRAWDEPLRGLWKLEFQRRGAPHLHVFMVIPARPARDGRRFLDWVSATWADVCAAPDPAERAKHVLAGTGIDIAEGLRATDPRRVAVYFSKHSSANFGDKEYQHIVPAEWRDGCGRFWGYWGLDVATAEVEVPLDDSIAAARIMRRWARAQGTTREAVVWRSRGAGGWRRVRRRVHRMPSSQGFLCVNDGPSFAWQIARFLDQEGDRNAHEATRHDRGGPAVGPPADRPSTPRAHDVR